MKKILISIFVTLIIFSCKDDKEETPAPTLGNLKVKFDNVVGSADLKLNTDKYTNANGDTFSVSMFRYYVSNVKLRRKSDQTWVKLPVTYNLIEEGVKSEFSFSNVTAADYDKIQYVVGIDSATNFYNDYSGDLNPDKGMFWTWSTGYVFLKVEGKYFNNPNADKSLVFHVGTVANLRTIELPLTNALVGGKTLTLSVKSDLAKVFDSPNKINFATTNNVMMGPTTTQLANNYSNMFSLTSSMYE